ncbi:MAG TPA: hypothetical protein VMB73_23970 [Acetobacteraceae bacterium]|nr:hypothetical protein [Acetobacteraceae bacterium]
MSVIVVKFDTARKRIGLVVRGKHAPDHHPDKLGQHADVILADGAPIGFFGEGNDGSFNSIGLGMQGVVYDYQLLLRHRPYYVDMRAAVANRVVSTVLLIEVEQQAADAFKAAWDRMKTSPGDFNIVGGNCATHASAAFIAAGVLDTSIPWLDTPDNLYGQLVDTLPAARRTSYSGYIGFKPVSSGGFTMEDTPYAAGPQHNKPNPGSTGSLGTVGRNVTPNSV